MSRRPQWYAKIIEKESREERLDRNREAIARVAEKEREKPGKPKLKLKRRMRWQKKRAEGEPARTKTNKVREWRSRWRVLAPSELPPITRLVLWEISDHMDWDTGDNAYPSMQSIVTGTGLTMKTVRMHRKLAVALGWLRAYERMKKHGLGLAYQVAFPSHDQKRRAPELIRKALTPKRKRRKVMP